MKILLSIMEQRIDLEQLKKKLVIDIVNPDLFEEALTHRSYLNEHKTYKHPHNERLEFLGDAVLELVVTKYLFDNFKNPEGDLTSFRASLVNGDMLGKIGHELGLQDFLLMSRGETKDTGRARTYLVANAMESVIGALYMDQGYDAAKKFIEKYVTVRLNEVLAEGLYTDPKSRFQELAQEKTGITPGYRVLKEWGPDHDRHFIAGVFLGEELVAEGEGISKQEAQREAARQGIIIKGWK
ncbi:MAG: ribonuclease III [Candidatus Moranbacteria bacterium]|nr:ribonuclease III [Candidatus Moranbacteria bacterium]PIP26047.1 MAG: ribonuclease III [Candidatus Moranbacteria bacterium CG23_combo_of_CG06-09_8_20_14_all_41_28]PIV86311.1 MAG: ribonuclease III [Candidatus Moranbacteria bacterium CG17_big_fil_post_rev_8_21_14_2_50_41_107]PIW94140.1 MAG: ribonuclease III [Candidatus Moranbacteria bacterium CG_4_8_14_3_um_filter_41_13]PIX91895.1 MAG: ribonuclease III [Candidatus Moranbacteria bacterium CG_4_10_14_3_um_filter_41_65]PJC00383.1 MAG: ribonucleas